MHANNFDMELFAADLPERLRESAFSGMVWTKASFWMLMEGNLRDRPRSPNVKRWEEMQAEAATAMSYYASFCAQPVDGLAIANFYTTNGSVRTYSEDEQAKHIANVAKLHGISLEEAEKRVEAADAAQARENKELKVKLHEQVAAIATKMEHDIVRSDPTEYKLTMKDLETFLIKVVDKGENIKKRMDDLVDRVRRPELQAAYKAVTLEVEAKLQEVSQLLLEVIEIAHREQRDDENQGRPVDQNDDRAMS